MLKRSIVLTFMCLSLAACESNERLESVMNVKTLDLSSYSSEKPREPIHLLFIHHSCGGQLLAEKGEQVGENCIYDTHPNGGGLRKMLQENKYIVHEASYGSLIGDKTDICHWNEKFRDHMNKILTCRNQDEFFMDGTRNGIVIFKSCYPNNRIDSEGNEPGNPDSCEHTTANYKAAYQSVLGYLAKQPDTLFVVLTAPPLAQPRVGLKRIIKSVLRPGTSINSIGLRARNFNNWLKDSENGWLKDYQLKNVVVFDYYDILTGYGKSNWSLFPTRGGYDSHPSSEGNAIAASELIPFLNRSHNRMSGK